MEPESPAVASLPPLASTLAAAATMMTQQESDSPKKKQSSGYSKENKIKRYDAILREFMTHFHGRSESEGGVYPANHEFSNEELRAIQPQDIGEFLFLLFW